MRPICSLSLASSISSLPRSPSRTLPRRLRCPSMAIISDTRSSASTTMSRTIGYQTRSKVRYSTCQGYPRAPLNLISGSRDALVGLECHPEQDRAYSRQDFPRLDDGELGLKHRLCLNNIEPVNVILDHVTLKDPLSRSYVRFVSSGRAYKPDIEFFCDSGSPTPIRNRPQLLAAFERKTSLAFPPDRTEAISARFEWHMRSHSTTRCDAIRS